MRGWCVALTAAVVLAGCGGSTTPDPAPTTAAPAEEGVPAPETMSGLQCAPTDQGTWTATGVITHLEPEPATYRVTAYVGPADGLPRAAVSTELEAIQPEGAAPFEVTGIPAHGEGPVCHVQVLRLE